MVRATNPFGWTLWRAPKAVVALVVGAYLAAAACVLPLSGSDPGDVGRFVGLALIGSMCTLVCLRMERARKFLEASNVPNLAATWTFAAALCLHHLYAIAVVLIIYAVQWRAQHKLHVGRPHRYLFSTATVVIGVRCAQLVHGPILAGLVLLGVNIALVATVLVAAGTPGRIRRMADVRDQALEVLTLGLGWIAATLFEWHVSAALLVVPVVVGVQYVALSRSVRQPSTVDSVTGALTARAWYALGVLRLAQVKEAIVLQVTVAERDADRLAQCAAAVRAAVRPEDLVGRMADGFAVLVAVPGGTMLADMLALSTRAQLALSGIDTYVGVAVTPDRGKPVDLQGLAVTAGADAIVRAAKVTV